MASPWDSATAILTTTLLIIIHIIIIGTTTGGGLLIITITTLFTQHIRYTLHIHLISQDTEDTSHILAAD